MHEQRIKDGMKTKPYRDFSIREKNLTPAEEKLRREELDFYYYRTQRRKRL